LLSSDLMSLHHTMTARHHVLSIDLQSAFRGFGRLRYTD